MATTYTEEQRKRAADLAKQQKERAKQERSEKIDSTLARNSELKKKSWGG